MVRGQDTAHPSKTRCIDLGTGPSSGVPGARRTQTTEYYPNGLSTSLPYDAHRALFAPFPAWRMWRLRELLCGKYDFVVSHQLRHTGNQRPSGSLPRGPNQRNPGMRSRWTRASCGINVAHQVEGSPRPDRLAYIGVLIDDLVTHGTEEPIACSPRAGIACSSARTMPTSGSLQ